jgi:predicted esterase
MRNVSPVWWIVLLVIASNPAAGTLPAELQAGVPAPQENESETDDALADVADVPSEDLTVGGNKMQRYFLIGARPHSDVEKEPPGLIVVVPGGDGSANFNPFLRRVYKNALDEHWLMAQAVAPQWDKRQANRVVWPTAGIPYEAAKFTTEEFIEAIIADVRAKAKIDERRIFLLGWSSGGPACYSLLCRQKTPVCGAFVAMSVFHARQLPQVNSAKDKRVYLLQSPDDRVTAFRFAEEAEKTLTSAGAKVRLQKYFGGHGWQGDVFGNISAGVKWLDNPAVEPATQPESTPRKTPAVTRAATDGNILLNSSFEEGDEAPGEWDSGATIDGVTYAWDKNQAHRGKASLCLHKTAKRYFPVAQWSQTVDRTTDSPMLQVSVQVKAERVTKAVIDVVFLDEKDEWIKHEWVSYIGAKGAQDPPVDHDWREYKGKVQIPEGTRKLRVGLQIYGPGKVWFDEARAEYVK